MAGSRKMTLKSGIRAVLAKTALIPLLTLIPVFTLLKNAYGR